MPTHADQSWSAWVESIVWELIARLRDYMLEGRGYDLYTEPALAKILQPFAEKLLANQDAADRSHYNDRFSSFNQLSDLLAHLDGRGTDPVIKSKVEQLVVDIHRMEPPVVTDQGPSEYEKQKALEYPWA
jgi:hypothetical protein